MSWEVILGPRQSSAVLAQYPHILRQLYGITSDRQLTGTSQAEASMICWRQGCFWSDPLPLCLTQRQQQWSNIGDLPSFWSTLDRKVSTLACIHHILEVLVFAACMGESVFGKVKSPENPCSSHFKDVWTILPSTPYNPVHQQKWYE
ncbi:hypothetical protein GWK47_051995 [Chionoecetes opilio]|uniref:Uncharacterized protein n=1 Tax=Chionoecetes opilio TaxID=41210 RepID=A0A8J4Y1Q5_CHIOP|nr:hypothetical protein GWK47_051995 [Chionoecetes opilio]